MLRQRRTVSLSYLPSSAEVSHSWWLRRDVVPESAGRQVGIGIGMSQVTGVKRLRALNGLGSQRLDFAEFYREFKNECLSTSW